MNHNSIYGVEDYVLTKSRQSLQKKYLFKESHGNKNNI